MSTIADIANLPAVEPLHKLSVETVAVMLRKGYSGPAIARAHNVSHQAVYQFIQRNQDELYQQCNYREFAVEGIKRSILQALRAMTPAKADKESYFYLARAIDSSVKAVELLEGRATQRVDSGNIQQQLDSIRSQREALEAELAKLEGSTVDITPSDEPKPKRRSRPKKL